MTTSTSWTDASWLGDVAPMALPTDRPRPAVPRRRAASEPIALECDLVIALRELGARAGTTLFATLVAGFAVLLQRYTHRNDVVLGTLDTPPLRIDLGGNPRATELVDRVSRALMGAAVPCAARPQRGQVMVALQQAPARETAETAACDLALSLIDRETGEVDGALEYDAQLFDAETVRRIASHCRRLLASMAAAGDRRIDDLEMLGDAERAQLVVDWNQTSRPCPRDQCLHELIDAVATQHPSAIAVQDDGGRVTYVELIARANRLAHHLRTFGIGPESRVGLCLDRSIEMVVGLLGILKAGAAYVPIDPDVPRARIDFLASDAELTLVVTERRLIDRLPSGSLRLVSVNRDRAAIDSQSELAPLTGVTTANAAYVIYTSGSTGQPKGVIIAHAGLGSLVAEQQRLFGCGPGTRVLQFAPLSFDASVFEICMALASGGTLCLADRRLLMPGPDLMARLHADGITNVTLPPSALAELEPDERLASLQTVVVAGETCSVELAARWCVGRSFYNAYGPTEATIWSTVERVDTAHTVSIGRPIANTQAYVLDDSLRPVPVGVVGELYLGGVGLARGYLKRPALTAERFVANPFGGEPGARLYRSGDLARYRADGRLEFVGRADGQVKVRGYRIDVGEIEAVLRQHAHVRDAAVVAIGEGGDRRLVAYVAGRNAKPSSSDLRRWLADKLPDYMWPARFVVLDRLPITSAGKVDRKALQVPALTRADLSAEFVAPHTAEEASLAAIWCEVLDLEQVGIDDDFFELGGHSLLATQVVSRVRRLLAVDLGVPALFEHRTVRSLARRIAGERPCPRRPAIEPAPRDTPRPLSFAQQRLWFLEQLLPGNTSYNVINGVRLAGALDRAALQRALAEIVRRHEVLRTRIEQIDGRGVQVVAPAGDLPLPVVDIGAAERDDDIQSWARHEAGVPFDLHRPPLLRARLLQLAADDHVLLVTMHHIASDGWSMSVLTRELGALYDAYTAGEPSPLPELPIQYADYAVWQRMGLHDEAIARALAYWRRQLAGAAPLDLPTDRPRAAVQHHRGASEPVVLEPALVRALKELGGCAGATLFMTLLAGFFALLQRYAGHDDIVVGTPVAGRTQEETEPLIGCFVNTLPLRTNLAGNPRVTELLARVKRTALDAYAHQDAPFEKLVDEIQPARDASRHPIYQVVFVMQNTPGRELALGGLRVRAIEVASETAKFDLTLSVAERGDGEVAGTIEYDTDLFDGATVRRFASHWRRLLAAMAAGGDRCLGELEMLADDEIEELRRWSRSRARVPDDTVVRLFEAQAARRPDAIAVVCGDEAWTYAKLNRRANRLAHRLQRMGVGPETVVGVCLGRSLALAEALLGILKAGGAYLPLDPEYPPSRLAFMLADAGARCALTVSDLQSRLPAATDRVCLDRVRGDLDRHERDENPDVAITPDNLAYVIYTSGSTGQPKGSLIPHRSIPGYFFGVDDVAYEGRTFLQHSSIAWDPLTLELWSPLLTGGRSVFYSDRLLGARAVADAVARYGVSLLWLPASLYASIIDEQPEALAGIEQLLIGGEALSVSHVRRGLAQLPRTRLVNGYGPSECTVFSTCYPIPSDLPDDQRSIPIGAPIGDRRVYVLDDRLRLVPRGVPGQLYVSGPAVARGYLKRPALTAARFLADPYGEEAGSRMYQTGDRVRWLPNGTLEFLGRVDHQMKVRGFRIEPGEIEAVLRAHEGVRDALVAVQESGAATAQLVAYLVPVDGYVLDPDGLHEQLASELPAYMVPVRWVVLKRFPLNANGKVDRAGLPRATCAEDGVYVPPRTPAEAELAAIWSEVLGAERVGVDDNFFSLGGDSILSIQIVARARRAGLELTPRQVFQNQTVAELAAVAVRSRRTKAEQGRVSGPVELTPIQRWFFEQPLAKPSHFNQAMLLELRRSVSPAALERAIRHCVEHHDALRMRYVERADGWHQVNLEDEDARVVIVEDLSEVPPVRHAREIEQRAARWQATLDVGRGPLLRVVLFELGSDCRPRLLVVVHHLVVDAVSWRILLADLERGCQQAAAGAPIDLGPKTSSYRQWAARLRQYAESPELRAELPYWRQQTEREEAEPDPKSACEPTFGTAREVLVGLDEEETRTLVRDVPTVYQAHVNEALVTALALALSRWLRSTRVRLHLEGHGREELFADTDVSRTIGWFTTLYPVALDVPPDGTPADTLRSVKEQLRRLPRAGIGYGLLRYVRGEPELLGPSGPAPVVCFNYLGQLDGLWSGRSIFAPAAEPSGPAQHPRNRRYHAVDVEASISRGRFQSTWTYEPLRVPRETIERAAGNFIAALRALVQQGRSPHAVVPTPSDFPLANLDPHALALVLKKAASEA